MINRTVKEDVKGFYIPEDLSGSLRECIVVVTGATGLIGSSFVRYVHSLGIGVKFKLPVRNRIKAEEKFADIKNANIILYDLDSELFTGMDLECDYLVHCASPTNGTYMSQNPVETFNSAVEYTNNLLEYCRKHPVKGMIYLSSIEYYGQIFNDEPITEDKMGHLDHCLTRNSYALGKQAAEFLVVAYAAEYGIPAKIARLTQTFGAGIAMDDNRVFAQFARSVVTDKKIVLHTQGRSAKPYCYLTDCVTALIYILIKGKNGEAYNVATPCTYVSIRELAEMFASFSKIENPIEFDFSSKHGYAPETRVNLDCTKLLELGWNPKYGLKEMVERLIADFRCSMEK